MSERFVDVYLLLLIDFKLLVSKVYVGEHHQVSAIRLISLRAIVEIVSPLVPFTGQWEFVIETFNKDFNMSLICFLGHDLDDGHLI